MIKHGLFRGHSSFFEKVSYKLQNLTFLRDFRLILPPLKKYCLLVINCFVKYGPTAKVRILIQHFTELKFNHHNIVKRNIILAHDIGSIAGFKIILGSDKSTCTRVAAKSYYMSFSRSVNIYLRD